MSLPNTLVPKALLEVVGPRPLIWKEAAPSGATAELSDRLIVMSQLSSQFLQEIFKVPASKIDMAPHGVPDLPFLDPKFLQGPFWR
jgi:hypothetical protein